MERIEEVISLGVSEAESQGKEFMQIPTSSVKIILSLIDTQNKEIEELRHYKNMYTGLFEGFRQNVLKDPKDIT